MTVRSVVDTNVLVAANGRDTHVDLPCQFSCVEELARLAREEVVCIDDRRLILREYNRRTSHRGQTRPGTVFYKHICQRMGDPDRVRVVPAVEPLDDEGREFTDPVLPTNNLKRMRSSWRSR